MIYEIVERTPGRYAIRLRRGGFFFPWRWVKSCGYMGGAFVVEFHSIENAQQTAQEQCVYYERMKHLPLVVAGDSHG